MRNLRQKFQLFRQTLVGLTLPALMVLFVCASATADEPVAAEKASGPGLSYLSAVILGIVEGATEYLPVSSTGHLLIVQDIMGLSGDGSHSDAADSLAICIQGGAILAVLLLYFGRVRQMFRGILGNDEEGRRLLINLVVAFLPAAVLGLLLRDTIKEYLFGVIPVAAALIAGGLLILLSPHGSAREEVSAGSELKDLQWHQALFIGLMQCVAMWPGFSRSLATILGCRWVGLRLAASVEFSFLLGLVTLSAATAWESLKGGAQMVAEYGIASPLIALVAAFIAAAFSVKFMVHSLGRFGLMPFGYYRILLGIACLIWLTRS